MFGYKRKISEMLSRSARRKRRGAVTVQYVMGLVFGTYLAANLLPEVVTAIQSVNTSGWTFTGHAGAAVIWGLTGLLVVVGIVQRLTK